MRSGYIVSLALVLLGCSSTAHNQIGTQSKNAMQQASDLRLAEGFIRCETFYKHYYESLQASNPSALKIPALAKLPKAIRFLRITAEMLVGEQEAKVIYGKNFEPQVLEFTKASVENWPTYSAKMNSECKQLVDNNNTESLNQRIKTYAEQKGITDMDEFR